MSGPHRKHTKYKNKSNSAMSQKRVEVKTKMQKQKETNLLRQVANLKNQMKQMKQKKRNRTKTRKPKGIPIATGQNSVAQNKGIRVRHREYVQDVISSIDFAPDMKRIQPADSSTFPLLSGIAQNFEKYTIHSLKAIYENSSSVTQNGTMYMYFDYDVKDVDPPTKEQLYNMDRSVQGPIYKPKSMKYMRDKDTLNKYYIISQQDLSANPNTASRFDSVGNFWYGTEGCAADGQTVGRIYFEYDIEFFLWDPTNKLPVVGAKYYQTGVPLQAQTGGSYSFPFTPIVDATSVPELIESLPSVSEKFGFILNKPFNGYLNIFQDVLLTGGSASLGDFEPPLLSITKGSDDAVVNVERTWYKKQQNSNAGLCWAVYKLFSSDPRGAVVSALNTILSSQSSSFDSLVGNTYVELSTTPPNMAL